jgi:hypothetical protein
MKNVQRIFSVPFLGLVILSGLFYSCTYLKMNAPEPKVFSEYYLAIQADSNEPRPYFPRAYAVDSNFFYFLNRDGTEDHKVPLHNYRREDCYIKFVRYVPGSSDLEFFQQDLDSLTILFVPILPFLSCDTSELQAKGWGPEYYIRQNEGKN